MACAVTWGHGVVQTRVTAKGPVWVSGPTAARVWVDVCDSRYYQDSMDDRVLVSHLRLCWCLRIMGARLTWVGCVATWGHGNIRPGGGTVWDHVWVHAWQQHGFGQCPWILIPPRALQISRVWSATSDHVGVQGPGGYQGHTDLGGLCSYRGHGDIWA